jgi:outer membrane protein assembly factor BamB
VGDHLYRLHSPGILKCFEVATGKQVYSERLPGITTTWSSPIADANGRLYFATAGKSYVIQSGPSFKILSTNDLPDPNHTSPAVSNGKLFLLGRSHLHCVAPR